MIHILFSKGYFGSKYTLKITLNFDTGDSLNLANLATKDHPNMKFTNMTRMFEHFPLENDLKNSKIQYIIPKDISM